MIRVEACVTFRLASNHLGVLTLPMLRQATCERNVHTRLLESFRSFNPPNAEAGDVERNVTTSPASSLGGLKLLNDSSRVCVRFVERRHCLESFRSFNPPNAEAGDVEPNVTPHSALEG